MFSLAKLARKTNGEKSEEGTCELEEVESVPGTTVLRVHHDAQSGGRSDRQLRRQHRTDPRRPEFVISLCSL
jgi:hypothetical protein